MEQSHFIVGSHAGQGSAFRDPTAQGAAVASADADGIGAATSRNQVLHPATVERKSLDFSRWPPDKCASHRLDGYNKQ
jgi:hypothetical protein